MALSIPFLIQNDDELDAVLRETRPLLDARIEQEGYVTMALVKGGWLKLFSRSPIFTPDDLRRLKLGASPDAPEMMDAFRSMGFNMVTTAMTDTVQKLNSGMVDAIYQSPIYISALQMYQIIGHMSSVNLAPFMGSVLMSRKAWASIPARYQSQLLETIRQAGIQIEQSFQKNEEDAIANMRRNGLTVNTASPAQEQEWRRYIQSFLPDLIERNIFNKTMYERIQSILQNYRQGS
jgi:TRAP-type C4-dicarboxylate transport system substrate-binding protein